MLVYHHVNCWNGRVKQEDRREGALKKYAQQADACSMSAPDRKHLRVRLQCIDGKEKSKKSHDRHLANTSTLTASCERMAERSLISAFHLIVFFFLFFGLFVTSRLRKTHAYNIQSCHTFELVSYDRLTSAQEQIVLNITNQDIV